MTDAEFKDAVVAACFRLAGDNGWPAVSLPAAALAAGLPLGRVREVFSSRLAMLAHFGDAIDEAVLTGAVTSGSVRDRLFDLLMRRFDALQLHRGGVLALMRGLPSDPLAACLLAQGTQRSMAWMLAAAGVPTEGLRGALRVQGLVAVWVWTLRTWATDETADLSTTMAAVDAALARAEQGASWLEGRGGEATGESPEAGVRDEAFEGTEL
jgi:hypothetical protein